MKTKLLTKKAAAKDAAAAVTKARAAVVAAKSPKTRDLATDHLLAAVATQTKADASYARAKAAAGPSAQTTHTLKHEERTVVKSDKPGAEDEEEDDEDAPPTKSGDEDEPSKSKDDEEDEEEDGKAAAEEEKAVARGWDAAEATYRAIMKGAGVDAYRVNGPKALREAASKATGKATIAEIRGALASTPDRDAHHGALAADVARLAAKDRAHDIDALIATGKKDGKILGKSHATDLHAQGMEHGPKWLAARLDKSPVIARTTALTAAEIEDGHVAGVQRVDEQAAADAQYMVGMTPEQAKAHTASLAKVRARRAERGDK